MGVATMSSFLMDLSTLAAVVCIHSKQTNINTTAWPSLGLESPSQQVHGFPGEITHTCPNTAHRKRKKQKHVFPW